MCPIQLSFLRPIYVASLASTSFWPGSYPKKFIIQRMSYHRHTQSALMAAL
jgi:hypothetical protein